MQGMRRALRFAIVLLQAFPLCVAAQQPRIAEDEIKKHFSLSPECEGVNINNLEYFDFTGSGTEDAIVVASTCATGTAGPDVHAVLHRQPDGSLAELSIPEPTEKQQATLSCRCFYDLNVKSGLLVATYYDQSGRDNPLVIKYRWDAPTKEFQVAEVKTPPRYKASFDCDKAKTAVENAICYSQNVAYLDVRVDQRYKTWLDNLNNADSDMLMKEQKDWLRKRDLICGNDTQTASCLETLYHARLLELEHFRHVHPAVQAH
jgi:uncharacterized protein YecT (DUF1311 family)